MTDDIKSSSTHANSSKRILVIEDEASIAELVDLHLSEHYENVCIVSDGLTGLEKAQNEQWDLIILDIRLPGMSGLDICRELRSGDHKVPILMVSSQSSELDRVLGLELGADDYLVKPFSVIELVARVKSMFRRVSYIETNNDKRSEFVNEQHNISINTISHTVSKNNQRVELTPKEFDLLCYFVQNPDNVFSRSHLLNKIWGHMHEGYEHTVNSHINRLRSKIEDDPAYPKIITTIWGVGYKLSGEWK